MQYLNWTHIPHNANDTLWINDDFNNMIKKHYSDLVNRQNVFTGKAYRDDDTCVLAAAVHAVAAVYCEVCRQAVWRDKLAAHLRAMA